MKIAANNKLVIVGDSITDNGRARPIGEGNGLGNGYVMQIDALLGAAYPERNIRVINTGTSGNRVRDLKGRWNTDVLDLAPDWVGIMIGVNDVWRQFDGSRLFDDQVLPEEFAATLDELVAVTKPKVKGVVLMTPFYLETNASDPMRARVDQYSRIVEKIAKKYDTLYVDLQATFLKVLEHTPTQALAGDRVHPNRVGDMVIARAFLTALGFEW